MCTVVIKYPLSYRKLIEMMCERRIKVSHMIIIRCVHQYSLIIEEGIKKHINKPTILGEWMRLILK